MANTALLQAVSQMLMQGRPPGGPVMPILDAPPTVPPVAPMPAQDQSLIAQLTGPPPVAPVIQQPGLLEKIATILLGAGAGGQGQGPQFVESVRERRERPMREFRAATEQFEDRRRGAIQFEEGLRQRERGLTQQQANIQAGQDFQMRELQERDRMQEARDLRLQAAQIEKEERQKQKEKEEADRKERLAQEKQRNDIAADLMKSPNFASQKIAMEIADGIVFGKPLSQAAEKFRSVQQQKAEKQLARLNGTGGTGSGKGNDNAASLVRRFNSLKAQFLRAEQPTKGMPFGDRALQQRIAAQYPAVMDALAKLGYEVGFDPSGVYPYQKPPQGQRQAQPTAQAAAPQQNDPGGIRSLIRQ